MNELLKSVYRSLFPPWTTYLKQELSGCKTLLDLGCGRNSPVQYVAVPYSVGVELFKPYVEESKRTGIHSEYILADVREVEFKENSFDAVLLLDVLEHLTKKDGKLLIKKCGKWAKKKVIISTPNGYIWQDGYDNNPLQEHKSGWNVKELQRLGFKIFGFNGWRKLRGYKASMKYKPALFWWVVSGLSQKLTYYYPKLAFQLLAVKTVAQGRER